MSADRGEQRAQARKLTQPSNENEDEDEEKK